MAWENNVLSAETKLKNTNYRRHCKESRANSLPGKESKVGFAPRFVQDFSDSE
jgi:hypothetical protein